MEDPFLEDQLQPFDISSLYPEQIEMMIAQLSHIPPDTLQELTNTFETVPMPVIARFAESLDTTMHHILQEAQKAFSRRTFLKRGATIVGMTLFAQWFLNAENDFLNDPNDLILTDQELNIFTPAGNSLAIGVGSLPINQIRKALEEGKTIGFVKPLVDLLNHDYYEKIGIPNQHNFAHFQAIENLLKPGITSQEFLHILMHDETQSHIHTLGKRIFAIVIGPDDIFNALEIIRNHVDSGNPVENLSDALFRFGTNLHHILLLLKTLSPQSRILMPTLPDLLASPAVAQALKHKPEIEGFLTNYMQTFNDVIKLMTKIHGVSCFRLDKTKIKVSEFSSDKLHPNQDGYNAIAHQAKQVCRIKTTLLH